ncbi:uncharacterized protein DS421_13g429460 [Arachis hypogaea]|nr:uncharacterized protein DS421_13g429460 [Arachis hypogaea]
MLCNIAKLPLTSIHKYSHQKQGDSSRILVSHYLWELVVVIYVFIKISNNVIYFRRKFWYPFQLYYLTTVLRVYQNSVTKINISIKIYIKNKLNYIYLFTNI